jgi:hypothetical protein
VCACSSPSSSATSSGSASGYVNGCASDSLIGGDSSSSSPWSPSGRGAPVGFALIEACRALVGLGVRVGVVIAAAAATAASAAATTTASSCAGGARPAPGPPVPPPPRSAAPRAATFVAARVVAGRPSTWCIKTSPLVAALERLEDAARETVDAAFNFVPIGEDAMGSANGDGVVFLRLLLLLLQLCRLPRCRLGRLALGLFDRRSNHH